MKICITGGTGQIGSYLTELCLENNHKVFAMKRRGSSTNTERLDHILGNPNLEMFYGDITDPVSIYSCIGDIKPDIIFNCAAQSHVKTSENIPYYTAQCTGVSVLSFLEAIKNTSPKTRFVTCSSSEQFGSTLALGSSDLLDENSPMNPVSNYAIAKLFAYQTTKYYREAMNLNVCSAWCFNTESPRRGFNFLPMKIVKGACRIKMGLQEKISVGNLHSFRDWGHAKDTSQGIYKIGTAEKPDDYIIASGESHSGQELVEMVFSKLDLDWKEHIVIDPKFYRAQELHHLRGNAAKIKRELGWQPKYSFEDLIQDMIDSEIKLAQREKLLQDNK